MPQFITGAEGTCADDAGMSWSHCSDLGLDKLQKLCEKCCGMNKCDPGQHSIRRDIKDSPDVHPEPGQDKTEAATNTILIPKPIVSLNTQNTSPSVATPPSEVTAKPARNDNSLQAPIIALIIVALITLVLCIFILLRGKKRKEVDAEMSFVKKEFVIDQTSPGTSLLNQHIGYEEYHGECFGAAQTSSLPLNKDAPIPDLEKTQVVEPPLNSHPAFKNSPCASRSQPDVEEITHENSPRSYPYSPSHRLPSMTAEPSELLMGVESVDVAQVSRTQSTSPLIRMSRSDKHNFPFNHMEDESSLPSPCSPTGDLGEQNFTIRPLVTHARNKSISKERKRLTREPPPWIEVFPQSAQTTSTPRSLMKGRNFVNFSRQMFFPGQEFPGRFKSNSMNPNHARVAADRLSGSTLSSNISSTHAVSDWCVSGDWGKATQYDDLSSYLNGKVQHVEDNNLGIRNMCHNDDPDIVKRTNSRNHFDCASTTSNLSDTCSVSSTESHNISDDERLGFDINFYKTGREGIESTGAITWGSWMER